MKTGLYLHDSLEDKLEEVKAYFESGFRWCDVERYCKVNGYQFDCDDMYNFNIYDDEVDGWYIPVMEQDDDNMHPKIIFLDD